MTYLRNHFRAKGQLGYKNSNSTLPHPPRKTKNKQKQNKNKNKSKNKTTLPKKNTRIICKLLLYDTDTPASVIIPFYNVNDTTINIYVHTFVFISIGIQKYV